jgi:SAM-dependent methyltransferase
MGFGRANLTPTDDRGWVFNRLAEHYPARPGYPDELVDRLAGLMGGTGSEVVELGAGIGDLAIPLAGRGLRVHAVEPARAMLSLLRERARELPAITAVHAAAESTGLPAACCDAVVLADAVQWVEPRLTGREVARLLRPGGLLAVVEAWPLPTPFMTALVGAIETFNPRARRRPPGRATQLFGCAGGRCWEVERWEDRVPLDRARLESILRSLSFVGPALGERALDDLLAAADGLAARCEPIWARELLLHLGSIDGPKPDA